MGKVDINLGIHNRWDIEVIDSKTGEVKRTATGYNVICDAFFNGFLNTEDNNMWPTVSAIAYGTGTGSPSSSDTSLFNRYDDLTVIHNIKEHVDMDNGVYGITRKFILNPEDAIGIDITEVGLIRRQDSSNYRLYTHAIFQDANGNPIVIHKTAIDIINIYSTFFIHFNPNGYDNGHIKVLDTFDNFSGNDVWSIEGEIMPRCGLALFAGYSRWIETGSSPNNDHNSFGSDSNASVYIGNMYVKRVGTNTSGSSSGSSSGSGFTHEHPSREVKDGTYAITRSGLRIIGNRIYDNCDNTRQLTEILISGSRGTGTYSNTYVRSLPLFSFKPGGSWFSGAAIAQEAVGTGDGVTTKFKTEFSNIKPNTCHVYVDGIEESHLTVNNDMPDRVLDSKIFAYFHLFPLTYASTGNHPTPCHVYKNYRDNESKGYCQGYDKEYLRTDSAYDGTSSSAVELRYLSSSSYEDKIRERIFYNTIHDTIGIKKISYYFYPSCYGSSRVYVSSKFYFAFSNDLENWIAVADDNMTSEDPAGLREFNVPLQYQHYKFIKISCSITSRHYSGGDSSTDYYVPSITNQVSESTYYGTNRTLSIEPTDEGYDIIFDTPPADGAIITADYTSLSLAKDSDHVFDFEFTINLNEYSGS